MFADVVTDIGELAESAGVAAVWTQWVSVTASAVPVEERRAWTIIDPEALLIASLAFQPSERRLLDLSASFVRVGGWLLSVTRVKRLMRLFGDEPARLLPVVASVAVEAGYRHWDVLVGTAPHGIRERGKELGDLRVLEPPALMLRLRAGFGLSAKPDLLAFLLGMRAAADVKTMEAALGYIGRGIRIAADNMALAGFIERIEGSPVTYRADVAGWARILQAYRLDGADEGEPGIPRWHDWAGVFAFLASAKQWAVSANQQKWSDYVASSRARDLAASHARVLRNADAAFALRNDARGAAYVDVFRRAVSLVAAWTRQSVLGATEPR